MTLQVKSAWAYQGRVFVDLYDGGCYFKYFGDAAPDYVAKVKAKGVRLHLWRCRRKPRLTKEQLVQKGRETGICQLCQRTLTNPDSIEAGIGPVCAGRI